MSKHHNLSPLEEITEAEYNQSWHDRLNRLELVADSIIQLSLRPPKILTVPAFFMRGFVYIESLKRYEDFTDLEVVMKTNRRPSISSLSIDNDNLITTPVHGASGLHEIGYFNAAQVETDLDEFLKRAANELSLTV